MEAAGNTLQSLQLSVRETEGVAGPGTSSANRSIIVLEVSANDS